MGDKFRQEVNQGGQEAAALITFEPEAHPPERARPNDSPFSRAGSGLVSLWLTNIHCTYARHA